MKNKLFKSALAVSLAFAMTLSSPVLAAESSAADSQIVETETNTPETSKTEGEAQTDKPSTPESESQNEKPSTPESESQNEKPSTPESESQNDKPSTPESESQNDKPSTPESESQDEKPLTPEKDSTEAFVARLYDTLLLRPADEQGLLEWTALLENHKATGADIIKGFIESDEFKAQNYSDEDYITVLYHALFYRTPDNTGLSQWLAVLDAHLSQNYVCHGFIGSDEFRALCKKYNILPGKLDVSGILDDNLIPRNSYTACTSLYFRETLMMPDLKHGLRHSFLNAIMLQKLLKALFSAMNLKRKTLMTVITSKCSIKHCWIEIPTRKVRKTGLKSPL